MPDTFGLGRKLTLRCVRSIAAHTLSTAAPLLVAWPDLIFSGFPNDTAHCQLPCSSRTTVYSMPRYSIDRPSDLFPKGKSPITNPAAVVNIARSQKVERAETNDAGMTVRYLLPRTGPQKSPLRPRFGLHPLDEGTATAYAAHHDEGSNRLSQGIRCHRDQRRRDRRRVHVPCRSQDRSARGLDPMASRNCRGVDRQAGPA